MAVLRRVCNLVLLVLSIVGNTGLATAEEVEPKIEIVDWGLTSAKEVGSEVSPDTPTGLNRLVEGPVNVTRTTKIHACIGTSFGILYRTSGIEDFGVLPITVVVFHPLIRAPDGRRMERSSWPDSAVAGRRYAGWVFEKNFELVSGSWTISLHDISGKELTAKSFDVIAGNCPIS
ncbi:MAG: DUF3859 domain-containing protein [Phyllobacterium sp.]|jgi:Domain of unknown function (DUF3859)|uniref:DUF3859 domain-containing protein n=1 Tax=Phyllobacterium sp. TaxID=1871046 RepID=UPI0030F1BC47